MDSHDWRVIGASVAGTSHTASAAPCQDSHIVEIVGAREPVAMLIASDGAGSAARAEFGSQLACRELGDCVRLFLAEGGRLVDVTREIALQWLESVGEAIRRLAEDEGRPTRDYACTLLASLIGNEHTVMLQVGDGAIVFRPRGDEGWCLMTWPQHGEYINSTVFVTDAGARARVEFCAHPHAIDEVAVFTDGIENLVLHFATQSVHGPFFDAIFPALRRTPVTGVNAELSAHLAGYLRSKAVCERTDDDKTLLLASRLPVCVSLTGELAED